MRTAALDFAGAWKRGAGRAAPRLPAPPCRRASLAVPVRIPPSQLVLPVSAPPARVAQAGLHVLTLRPCAPTPARPPARPPAQLPGSCRAPRPGSWSRSHATTPPLARWTKTCSSSAAASQTTRRRTRMRRRTTTKTTTTTTRRSRRGRARRRGRSGAGGRAGRRRRTPRWRLRWLRRRGLRSLPPRWRSWRCSCGRAAPTGGPSWTCHPPCGPTCSGASCPARRARSCCPSPASA